MPRKKKTPIVEDLIQLIDTKTGKPIKTRGINFSLRKAEIYDRHRECEHHSPMGEMHSMLKGIERQELLCDAMALAAFLLGQGKSVEDIISRIEQNYADVSGVVEEVSKRLLRLKEQGEGFHRGPTIYDRIVHDQLKQMFGDKDKEGNDAI
jgi:hypothetical protein